MFQSKNIPVRDGREGRLYYRRDERQEAGGLQGLCVYIYMQCRAVIVIYIMIVIVIVIVIFVLLCFEGGLKKGSGKWPGR